MNYKNLLITISNKIAFLTLNRPDKLNALNKSTLNELHDGLKSLEKNNDVRVIIITGNGEKAFVAGADISEFANFSVQEGMQLATEGQEKVFNYIENLSKPVIAAINGFALGGGLELAMACHFRIASDNAKMGLPEVSLGLIPGYGGTQRLPQLVGKGRAMELIMTATMITAKKAKKYGLVNHVVSQTALIEYCQGLAEKIIPHAPIAISEAIHAINEGFNSTQNGYKQEINAFGNLFDTADFKEGTKAFLEKRVPRFIGK